MLAQRCGEWVARAPELEEDVALANIGLDLLGQARTLLTLRRASVEGAGRDEDDLAYLRDERDFRNVQLVEIANGDFAVTIARLLVFSTYQHLLYAAAGDERRPHARRDRREGRQGGRLPPRPRRRVGAAPRRRDRREPRPDAGRGWSAVWPYVDELFAADGLDPALVAAVSRSTRPSLRPEWDAGLAAVLDRATLHPPEPGPSARGGRRGVHTDAMGHLLAEMQHLHRSHPGASW